MKFCPQCGLPLSPKVIDDAERLGCVGNCGFIHWDNPIPVVAALVRVAGSFLLARNARWPPGFFSLISGFLEAGEKPDAAIVRETYEELGLKSEKATFVGHYSFPQMNQIIIAYVVEASGVPEPNSEIAELKWLSFDELKAYEFGPLKLSEAVVKDSPGSHNQRHLKQRRIGTWCIAEAEDFE